MTPKRPSFRESISKVLYLHEKSSEDECDRIPSNVKITWFDLSCYFFSIFTYTLDIFMDVFVAVFYFRKENVIAAALTATFVFVPSIILNVISFLFFIDDEAQDKESDTTDGTVVHKFVFTENIKILGKKSKSKVGIEVTDSDHKVQHNERGRMAKWVVAVLLQVGPLLWYFKAVSHALRCFKLQKLPRRERLYHQHEYYSKIEADRDAGVLRFFEACLEAMPQLLVQGYFLSKDWQYYNHSGVGDFHWQWRSTSLILSLISISYSFVSHHRVLRISLPQKQNLNPQGCYMIFIWRIFTITARFITLTVILVVNNLVGLLLVISHLIISTITLCLVQKIDTKSKTRYINPVMFIVNLWIHIFAPFNMAEGPSRLRYCIHYGLEIIESMVVIALCNFYYTPVFPYVDRLLTVMGVCYISGIISMVVYHTCMHPNYKTKLVIPHLTISKV
ncbi:unnamed protein product [Bursaphelenchus okinawaensis]|uniref:XK-related protein n=1 Tax=Bursaphelenchus okinawaensis TaxID=465554 RepID=A0A811KWF8_9BILA|nr:unnamed protein product [Bursaphelenchus okinawaensis]CAG9113267.1 unnamed protein product [Bursaphelenchus okinawaensis]